jgi:hypothetical protein
MFRRLLGLVPPQTAWFTHAPLPASSSPVTLSYLGTAGFVLSAPERTVVLDPFVTRHPLATCWPTSLCRANRHWCSA